MTWITDTHNNRCSVEYWGSTEAAQKALNSLQDCSGCSDCSRCSGCLRCLGCVDCSNCADLNEAAPMEQSNSLNHIENIHQAVYAAASQPNSLAMNEWHTCKNTHCRAGWVVTLAGEAGGKLESR